MCLNSILSVLKSHKNMVKIETDKEDNQIHDSIIEVGNNEEKQAIIEDPKKEKKTIMENERYLVILGTAHLSSTPGKRSPETDASSPLYFREYAYSREICKKIKLDFDEMGIDCVLDYEGDDMSGLNSSQELVRRCKIVNQYCASRGTKYCVYVSVHVNAAGNSGWKNATGWSIYTTPGQNNSDALATSIYNEAKKLLEPLGKKIRTDWSDGDADYESDFYVLKHSNCPAVLTENFFQDSKSDVQWLKSDEGKNAIVDLHVNGILAYLNSKKN